MANAPVVSARIYADGPVAGADGAAAREGDDRAMELHDARRDTTFRHEFEAVVAFYLFTAMAMVVAIALLLIL